MWLRRLFGVAILVAGVRCGAAAQVSEARQSVSERIAADASKLDLNTATPEQLKALPGMGEAYVKRVIEGRPYTAKNQLATRGILPVEEYKRIQEQVIAHRVKKQT